jgi:hypothetical protein
MLPVLRRNRIERKARRVARMLSELDARAGSPKRAKPQPRGNAASVSLARN